MCSATSCRRTVCSSRSSSSIRFRPVGVRINCFSLKVVSLPPGLDGSRTAPESAPCAGALFGLTKKQALAPGAGTVLGAARFEWPDYIIGPVVRQLNHPLDVEHPG